MLSDEKLLGGRYRLGSRLGRGGMGEVRLGLDIVLGRAVAIKLLSAELAGDPAARKRFQCEAQSAARLNHPFIVAVFDSGEAEDPVSGVSTPYIVMELVEGQTFGTLLRRGDPLSTRRVLQLISGVLTALAHSHDAGIVHQDIKPGNVMLDQSGDVKVMDFGIARSISDTLEGSAPALTVLGSARYLSPEQARGETTDVRSDIYSSGCLLYELLTGRPPFIGDSPQHITVQHLHTEPTPPSRLNSAVDAELDAVVLRALAKDSADRYQSARDMVADVAVVGERVAATAAASSAVSSTQVRAFVSRVGGMPVRGVRVRTRPRRAVAAQPSGHRRRSALAVAAVTAVVFPLGGFGLYSLNQPGSAEAQGASLSQVLQAPAAQADVRPGAVATSATRQQAQPSGKQPSAGTTGVDAKSGPTSGATSAAGSAVRRSAGSGWSGGSGDGVGEEASFSPSATADVPHRQAAAGSITAPTGQDSASAAAPSERQAVHQPAAAAPASRPTHAAAPTTSVPKRAHHAAHSAPVTTAEPSARPPQSHPSPEPIRSKEPASPASSRPAAVNSHQPATKERADGARPHRQGPKRRPADEPNKPAAHGSHDTSGAAVPVVHEHQKPAEHVKKAKPEHVKPAVHAKRVKPAKKAEPGKPAKNVHKSKAGQHQKRDRGVKVKPSPAEGAKAKNHGQHKSRKAAAPPVAGDSAPTPGHGHGKGRHKPKP